MEKKLIRDMTEDELVNEMLERLSWISKRAFYAVCIEEGCNIPKGEKGYFDDGDKVDELDKQIFELMVKVTRDGMKLENSLVGRS